MANQQQNNRPQQTGTAKSRAGVARRAVRRQTFARLALSGASGAGKTWTALDVATKIADGKPILVIDTEPADSNQGAAELYADHFEFDVIKWDPPYDPRDLALTLREFYTSNYAAVLVDSASHFWRGEGGTLDIAGGRFSGWKTATPVQDDLVSAILRAPYHVIVCTRAKQDYEVQTGSDGKQEVTKLGLAPIQRDDLEYEFQVVVMMDQQHTMEVGKTRCADLAGKKFQANHQGEFGEMFHEWLAGGVQLARQADVDLIRTVVRAVPPPDGTTLRRDFKATFGEPASLSEDRVGEVWAWLVGQLDINVHPFDEGPQNPEDPERVDPPICHFCGHVEPAKWHDPDAPVPATPDKPENAAEDTPAENVEKPSEPVEGTDTAPDPESSQDDPVASETADSGVEQGTWEPKPERTEEEHVRYTDLVVAYVKQLRKPAVVFELNKRELSTSGNLDALGLRLATRMIEENWQPPANFEPEREPVAP